MNSGLTSVSPKGLLDALSEDKSEQVLSLTTNTKQETIKFKSVSLFLREATTSIPEYNQLLIGILNELYMCKNRYGEKIRGFEYSIENPHLFILMGNQPATFYKVFPLSASSTGIMARIVSVYNSGVVTGVKTWLDPEDEQILDNSLWDSCTEHLLEISTWAGQLKTTRDFRQAINLFEETNPAPVPGERFKEWNSRRSLNLAKISICLAASEKEQIISSHHWDRALEYVFEIEARMPDAFLNIITDRGFSEELDNIPQLAGPEGVITQYKLLTKLSRTRPPHEAAIIIDQAVKSGLLNIVYDEAGTPKKPTIYSIHPSEARGKTIQ